MGFVHRILWILKALWIVLSETINNLRNLKKKRFRVALQQIYHRVIYIVPSSGHSLVNLNIPFTLILRRFAVVFWCLEWECCTFQKTDENSFKSKWIFSHQNLLGCHLCHTNPPIFMFSGWSVFFFFLATTNMQFGQEMALVIQTMHAQHWQYPDRVDKRLFSSIENVHRYYKNPWVWV